MDGQFHRNVIRKLVDRYSDRCVEASLWAKQAMANVPTIGPVNVYCGVEDGEISLEPGPGATDEDMRLVKEALSEKQVRFPYSKTRVKIAESPALNTTLQWLNYIPGKFPWGQQNFASPLAATLTSGLLGAGLGYGTGWLAEKLFPERWDRNRIRTIGAVLGGLAGATPGAIWMGLNASRGKSVLDPTPFTPYDARGYRPPETTMTGDPKPMDKISSYGLEGAPPVQVDEFNRVIWGESTVANRLNPQTRIAASAALDAAQRLPGGMGAGLVTPSQMARLAWGMGTGYGSGMLVGKVLGMLTGMPQDTQDLLKQTGMYAGLVNAAVPKLFGQ